jgi:hypothetical protein
MTSYAGQTVSSDVAYGQAEGGGGSCHSLREETNGAKIDFLANNRGYTSRSGTEQAHRAEPKIHMGYKI